MAFDNRVKQYKIMVGKGKTGEDDKQSDLLNPLPALGVAPEIRGHVLMGPTWQERLAALKKGLDASHQHVQAVARVRSLQSPVDATGDEIDVCRIS